MITPWTHTVFAKVPTGVGSVDFVLMWMKPDEFETYVSPIQGIPQFVTWSDGALFVHPKSARKDIKIFWLPLSFDHYRQCQ